MTWCRTCQRNLGPARPIPLPHVTQRRIPMRRGATIKQHDTSTFVVDHAMGVSSPRAAFGRATPALPLPDPGVVEERLRLVRSRRRAHAAEQHNLAALAVVRQCRPATSGRSISGDARPLLVLHPPRVGRPRTRSVGRDPSEHENPSGSVFHQRVVVAGRDVGNALPAGSIAFPAILDDLPRGISLPRTACNHRLAAASPVSSSGIDASRRSRLRRRLPP
jgi:hypothetical protein